MPQTRQTKAERIRKELEAMTFGPGDDPRDGVDLDALAYMLSLSPAERLRRNEEACRVVRRLEAVAARRGLKAVAWQICEPARQGR